MRVTGDERDAAPGVGPPEVARGPAGQRNLAPSWRVAADRSGSGVRQQPRSDGWEWLLGLRVGPAALDLDRRYRLLTVTESRHGDGVLDTGQRP